VFEWVKVPSRKFVRNTEQKSMKLTLQLAVVFRNAHTKFSLAMKSQPPSLAFKTTLLEKFELQR